MVASALPYISTEFHIQDAVVSQLTLSIFNLGYAIGPLFLGPLSETFGRVIVLQLDNLFYLRMSLVWSFRFLSTQVIVQVLALYMAYTYGLMYLMLSTFPTLWTDPNYYGESTGISGLNYISLGFGSLLGFQICAILNDRVYRRYKACNNNVGKPEFRIPLLALTIICVPAGLFIYGWTA